MALVRLSDIRFYTGLTETAQQQWEMKKWLDDNNISYISMNYSDDSQHQQVFKSLNGWWPEANIINFPILTYTEIHDDLEVSQFPVKYFLDVATLSSSSFLQDYNLKK